MIEKKFVHVGKLATPLVSKHTLFKLPSINDNAFLIEKDSIVKFDFDRMNFTSYKKNNFNIEHTHPNNYLSAAYYVSAPENCGSFNVSNPNQVSKERIAISDKRTEFNQNIAQIKPVTGDLLLFPAYLPHSVGTNLSDEDRIVISFNLVC